MKLLEILNTVVTTKWNTTLNGIKGTFSLDGEDYGIMIDEYDVQGKVLVDFGFDRNQTIDAVKSDKNASKILGAVLNSAIPKIKEVQPDFILIAVYKSSGLTESRKSLYELLCKWFQKRMGINFISEWQETTNAFFKIMALKEHPTAEQIDVFIKVCKSK